MYVANYLVEEARIRHHLEEATEGCSATPGLRLQLPRPQQDHGRQGTQRHCQLAEEGA